ncbi:unnamed protein product [Protopolystoma xenopodis]|uniref:Uncharacterized protein n=1 Tax=Protopolystoma xenopodis TaxID=117903 RepID=A0A448WCV5_9PLAT|nr:unnamed protein product [Protopolystoma xenopodis]
MDEHLRGHRDGGMMQRNGGWMDGRRGKWPQPDGRDAGDGRQEGLHRLAEPQQEPATEPQSASDSNEASDDSRHRLRLGAESKMADEEGGACTFAHPISVCLCGQK